MIVGRVENLLDTLIKLSYKDTYPVNLVSLSGGKYGYHYSTLKCFFDVYKKAVEEDYLLDFAEIPLRKGYSRLVVDVDLEKESEVAINLHDTADVEKVYRAYVDVLTRYIPMSKCNAFLLEKQPYMKSENICKHGFHLHFINIFLTIEDKKFIREEAQKLTSFKLDAVDGNPWLLYSGSKNEKSGSYKITGVFEFAGFTQDYTRYIPTEVDNLYRWMSINPYVLEKFPEDDIFTLQIKNRKVSTHKHAQKENFSLDYEDKLNNFLERKGLLESYSVRPDGRIVRLAPSECLVNPANTHDTDNAYFLQKNEELYVGCYRKCQINGTQLVPVESDKKLTRLLTTNEREMLLTKEECKQKKRK